MGLNTSELSPLSFNCLLVKTAAFACSTLILGREEGRGGGVRGGVFSLLFFSVEFGLVWLGFLFIRGVVFSFILVQWFLGVCVYVCVCVQWDELG